MLVNKLSTPSKYLFIANLVKNTLHTTLNSIRPWWVTVIPVPAGVGQYYQHSIVITTDY
jgi:hypothetical protein